MDADKAAALGLDGLMDKIAKVEQAYETVTDPELLSASKAGLVALRALVVAIPPVIDAVVRFEAVIEKHQAVKA